MEFTLAFRELYGDKSLEEFSVHETPDGWVFVYEPLSVVTGRIARHDFEMAARRSLSKFDLARWMDVQVKKACDISPLRIMQIAQVGL